jgi:hypothetical protein
MIVTVTHDTTPPVVAAVTQSVDPSLQLVVTFNEILLDASLETASFSVVDAENTPQAGPLTGSFTTQSTVTLALEGALPAGSYRLLCPGVRDIATPDGNSITTDYFFDFTIQ